MNLVFNAVLSMSVSGGLLILVFLLAKRFWKDKISRQWQYYIWLIVILRLMLPFGPEASLMGTAYQAVARTITRAADPAIAQTMPLQEQIVRQNAPEDAFDVVGSWEPKAEIAGNRTKEPTGQAGDLTAVHVLRNAASLLMRYSWMLWLAVASGMLLRKITAYQGFLRYVDAGSMPVSDIGMLDQLSVTAKQAGINRPVELCINPLVSSPLLTGLLHPRIVLPDADIPEEEFQYIALHELTHCRRQDMLYKWLVQVTVCLHWFNPLVHRMSREIVKACEFSCDEAILAGVGEGSAQAYGKTLLNAMVSLGKYREHPGAVPLSENKQLLKERLGAIMSFKKPSRAVRLLTGALTLGVICGASFIGVYPVAAASDMESGRPPASGLNEKTASSVREQADGRSGEYASQIERYYEADSLPLFQIAFSRLDEKAQEQWLSRIYGDHRIAFWGAAVDLLDEDCDLVKRFAKKAYASGDIACFSVLTRQMSEEALEAWLDRALQDKNWVVQSMVFDALDRTDKMEQADKMDWDNGFDWGDAFEKRTEKQEKEWAEAQAAEYRAVGITMDGKNYYYQGQLVDIFLDIRPNKSFYTLDMNPAGTVNIKVTREEDGTVAGVAYMTDAEAAELLGDENDPDDENDLEDFPKAGAIKMIPVDLQTMAGGEIIYLGDYTLSEGDRIWYDVQVQAGSGLQIGFVKPGDENLNIPYYSVINNGTQRSTFDITAGPLATPETYRLFLRATGDALKRVTGCIFIAPAETV